MKMQQIKLLLNKTKIKNNNNNKDHFKLSNLKLLIVLHLIVIQQRNHLINFMSNLKLDL